MCEWSQTIIHVPNMERLWQQAQRQTRHPRDPQHLLADLLLGSVCGVW